MHEIRRLRVDDFPIVLRLTDQEQWGVTSKVLKRILKLNPDGSFVALKRKRPVAMLTTALYGNELAWIGNVVVEAKKRGTGIGRALVQHALGYLRGLRVSSVALYCYEEHVKFYEKLGFVRAGKFDLLSAKDRPIIEESFLSTTIREIEWDATAKLDSRFFGADRLKLLKLVAKDNPQSFRVAIKDNRVIGFVSAEDSPAGAQLGPLVCEPQRTDTALELATSALAACKSFPVDVGVLSENAGALDLFEGLGFSRIRRGFRMFHGKRVRRSDSSGIFAIGFLDKG